MPSIGHDGGLALRTIDGKELIRLVVSVGITYGYDDLAGFDIKLTASERLVDPELLDVHFAAFLYLGLVFASLLGLYFHSGTIATVFKLNLRTQGPSFTEIVAQIQHHVRQVETSMTFVIGIKFRLLVTIKTLAVEVACHHRLAIATDMQA